MEDAEQKFLTQHEVEQDLEVSRKATADLKPAHYMRLAQLQTDALVDKFKILREKRGWSQEKMCRVLTRYGLEIHQTTLAKIEAKSRPLKLQEAYIFCFTLEIPMSAIHYLDVNALEEYPQVTFIESRIKSAEETLEIFTDTLNSLIESTIKNIAGAEADKLFWANTLARIISSQDKEGESAGE